MFVKGLKGDDEDASVLQVAVHAVVNVLQHLATLPTIMIAVPPSPTSTVKYRDP